MKHKSSILFFFAICLLWAPLSTAGGPYYNSISGTVSHWDELVIHPEVGSCGALSNADTIILLEQAILAWQDLAEVDFNYTITSDVVPDVDSSNFQAHLVTGLDIATDTTNATNGINPIVFDDDGSITEALMGTNGQFSFVGLTSINNFSDNDLAIISKGQMILNCRCLETHPTLGSCNDVINGTEVSLTQFKSVMVHEIGHFLNLGHSIANEEFAADSNPDSLDLVSTMYPFVFESPTPFEVSQDDVVAMASVYPTNNFTDDYCKVTGTLLDKEGGELHCANVVATSSNPADTVTFVTGTLNSSFDVSNEGVITATEDCTENCGDFQLFLIPDTSYTLAITLIDENFVNASGVGPCVSAQPENIVAKTPLASITASSCTPGAIIDLGEITTNSEAEGTTAAPTTTDDETGSSGTDNTNQLAEDKTPKGCSLVLVTNHQAPLLPLLVMPFILFVLRFKSMFVKLLDLM